MIEKLPQSNYCGSGIVEKVNEIIDGLNEQERVKLSVNHLKNLEFKGMLAHPCDLPERNHIGNPDDVKLVEALEYSFKQSYVPKTFTREEVLGVLKSVDRTTLHLCTRDDCHATKLAEENESEWQRLIKRLS